MDFLSFFLLSRLDGPQRKTVMAQLLPAMLPFPIGQRVAFTAMLAEQQVKRQLQTEHLLVKEAVTAAGFKKRLDLEKSSSPTLLKVFDSLPPELQATVFK